MKTTVNIPDIDLADAIRFTKAKTKREAIVTAIQEFNAVSAWPSSLSTRELARI